MRGILAIEPLYHQIVAGNKTQTRRSGGLDIINESPDNWELLYVSKDGSLNHAFKPKVFNRNIEILSPRYKVGEVLYLKEPIIESELGTYYKYGDGVPENAVFIYKDGTKVMCPPIEDKWSNKLFMPASAARAFVRITDIRCERLLNISDVDCIAEGIEPHRSGQGFKDYATKDGFGFFPWPKQSFISLYKFANKMKASAEIPNIWVWVYTFEYLPNYQITK